MRRARIVGRGRAGSALALGLERAGWTISVLGRGDDLSFAATGVDLVVLAVPDADVGAVAASVLPVPTTVVAHLGGSLGLDVLAPHARRASVHPLTSLPRDETGETGALRLRGAWFAIDGDALASTVVDDLGGRAFAVNPDERIRYHAAAAIASNHLVALLSQVERVAAQSGVPLEAFVSLVRATVDNVADLGPAAALTGPVGRGDWATVRGHLAALDPDERPLYLALAAAAAELAGRQLPEFDEVSACR